MALAVVQPTPLVLLAHLLVLAVCLNSWVVNALCLATLNVQIAINVPVMNTRFVLALPALIDNAKTVLLPIRVRRVNICRALARAMLLPLLPPLW